MSKLMLGRKAGMTQIFDESGNAIPVTVIDCGPLTVVHKKTTENDGYEAIKVAYEEVKKANKPDQGQFAKHDLKPMRHMREFQTDEDYEIGQVINVAEMFEAGCRVDISGSSKGKGYAGGIKRHNFSRGPVAHGSKYHRSSGSLGSSATPAKVHKGQKLPGQMGNERVTVQNLDVVMVDGERNILVVKGSVPGSRNNLLEIRETVKAN
ncbi:MAG: 50S ribosomal protein L3 [Eubacteriales bacterium]|nr:50S ribosomal protein L3 [Clostridiales bacterium]MDY5836248.1 50S ribosomal protein L3 [Eubacteriales bacterium]